MQNLLYDDLDKLLITKENKIEESIFLMFINKEQLQCKNKHKKVNFHFIFFMVIN